MADLTVRHVICAVRGGPESRATVTRAIDLALESGARLTFFHVADAEFLEHATVGPLSVVYAELVEMATFAMIILCDRAQRRGADQVDYLVREGNVRKQLLELASETRAELLVMGRPTRSPGRNLFRPAEFDQFIGQLEEEGPIRVICIPATPAGPP
jgi:nucleotide-binding universal stress UspA family protein